MKQRPSTCISTGVKQPNAFLRRRYPLFFFQFCKLENKQTNRIKRNHLTPSPPKEPNALFLQNNRVPCGCSFLSSLNTFLVLFFFFTLTAMEGTWKCVSSRAHRQKATVFHFYFLCYPLIFFFLKICRTESSFFFLFALTS